jgi:hypothetical protein
MTANKRLAARMTHGLAASASAASLWSATALAAGPSTTAAYHLLTTIAVPGNPLASFDISTVNPTTNRFFLSDRSNQSLDIIDATSDRFVGRVAGFSGPAGGNNNLAGPDGNAPVGKNEVWVGNGDSTVKVVNLTTMSITDSISTGGQARADEMVYDPKDQLLLVANDADSPPFVSLIYTKPGYHKVVKKIVFRNATNGIEAS